MTIPSSAESTALEHEDCTTIDNLAVVQDGYSQLFDGRMYPPRISAGSNSSIMRWTPADS